MIKNENKTKLRDMGRADQIAIFEAWLDGNVQANCGGWSWCNSPTMLHPDDTYRIAATPDRIDWSHVSDKFNCTVRNPNGLAILCQYEPEQQDDQWDTIGPMACADDFASYKRGTCDWKDSLVRRPF